MSTDNQTKEFCFKFLLLFQLYPDGDQEHIWSAREQVTVRWLVGERRGEGKGVSTVFTCIAVAAVSVLFCSEGTI